MKNEKEILKSYLIDGGMESSEVEALIDILTK